LTGKIFNDKITKCVKTPVLIGGRQMADQCPPKRVVGAKQTLKAVLNCKVAQVYIAKDAEEHVVKKIKEVCEEKGIKIVYIDTMKELGRICGIDVGAATAADVIGER
jgi:large subunit ribosomal protein L7A